MAGRELSAVESTIDEDIAREIEGLRDTYDGVEAAAAEAGRLDGFESHLSVDIAHVVEQLKRARQWEHVLEAHQQGLVDHAQVIERIDNDVFGIEAQVTRTERDLDGFADTVEATRADLDDEPELAARLADLLDGLEHQREQLAALLETLEAVDTDLQNAGVVWME